MQGLSIMGVLNELFVKRFRKQKEDKMIIINYKSKRQLKKAIGKPLECIPNDITAKTWRGISAESFFVTNHGSTFHATVVMENGIIKEVR